MFGSVGNRRNPIRNISNMDCTAAGGSLKVGYKNAMGTRICR